MKKLKKCPFCGGDPIGPIVSFLGEDGDDILWEVYCNECFVSQEGRTEEETTEAWNRRYAEEVCELSKQPCGLAPMGTHCTDCRHFTRPKEKCKHNYVMGNGGAIVCMHCGEVQ